MKKFITIGMITATLMSSTYAWANDGEKIVSVAAVNTTISTGLMQSLIPDFEHQTGIKVELVMQEEATSAKKGRSDEFFKLAEQGEVDLLIAHYGLAMVQPFVDAGKGEFPQFVFANQSVLIGPKSDPAQIKGMTDLTEALKKIEKSGAKFIENPQKGAKYLSSIMRHGLDEKDSQDWYIKGKHKKGKAVGEAEKANAYTIFGLKPFLTYKERKESEMEMQIWADPMLQRPMVSVVVKPSVGDNINHAEARAFQDYLLSASTQAKVKAFRMDGLDLQLWWPAARANNPAQMSIH